MKEKNFVTYLDFGAVGDGMTDDFAAIVKAHDYANENGLPVITDDGRTYYIHDTLIDGEVKSAIIRTDVNWGNSSFIIDDTDIDYYDGTKRASSFIFNVVSDYEKETITDREILSRLDGIGEGTEKLDISFGYPAMLVLYDENASVFNRCGASYSGKGSPKKELIVIDSDGRVDGATPFMFDYATVTRLDVIRTDITPITVKGGKFTTRGCRVDAFDNETKKKAGYYARGIFINRSHTVIEGVEHYVVGEFSTYDHRDRLLEGPHYRGFYVASHANGVTIKNCVLTGRRYYHVSGTYEFSGDMVNKIYLIGCTQSNFRIKDEEGNTVFSMACSPVSKTLYHWGIGGTNFCKNMEYINCTLSRFDAHQGLYNGKMIGCTMNFMELTGKGELLIEDLEWYSPGPGETYNSLAYLRNDYGSTWEGTITFRNCTAHVSSGDFYIFEHSFANWYFGYTCYFPNLILDNLKIEGLEEGAKAHLVTETRSIKKEPNLHLPTTIKVPEYKREGEPSFVNKNPIIPPRFIKVVNNNSGYPIYLTRSSFFENTEIEGITFEVGE